jgi:benzoyl-CoA reductase/2-hydroxyglutaryl-CoA dehydratase subunit BcrC/BadD/HgdB
MEDKLRRLMSAGSGENRIRWARDWHKRGKKVIGVLDSLVPEEVICAAGMLPWRIHGAWQDDISKAMAYRYAEGNTFLNHVLQSVLDGEFDFLDGVVCSNRDEDFVRFRDYWEYLRGKISFLYLVEVPVIDSELTRQRFTTKIQEFVSEIEQLVSTKINDASLHKAIAVYDKSRTLLKKVYELRKRGLPPLSGGEALAVTAAAMVMPREQFNKELEELLPYLEKRKANVKHTRPRLLLSSDLMDGSAYIDFVEEVGCLVAMDDLDTGSRYFWEVISDGSVGDPLYALARRYLKNHSPRMFDWRWQVDQIVQWVEEYRIDGVLELPDFYDYTRAFRKPFVERWLKEAGIPVMSFERTYYPTNMARLSTRVGAFLEMLESRIAK